MFDLSWSHIFIVMLVALVVVGPKDLPKLMRVAGQWAGKARAMASEFRKSFDDMARQSELDELRDEIEALRKQRPLADIADELHQSILPPDDLPLPTGAAPQEAVEPGIEQPAQIIETTVPTGSAPQEAMAPAAEPPIP
jgi:sec-independent protein translocase protein TatB